MRFSRNHCLRRLEQKQKQRNFTFPCLHWEDTSPEARLQKEQEVQRLHAAIDRLKSPQRDCLLGFYFEDRSYREIALHLQFSLAAVKSHIQNGKRNLRKLLVQSPAE